MTKNEFKQAVKIAETENLDNVDDSILFGCGLPQPHYEKIHCTLKQVAKFIKYQALQFNGNWDSFELDNCAQIAKQKFLIIG